MSLLTGLAIYFIIWWLVLFTVLPWGIRSHHEAEEETVPGGAPSAPLAPRLAIKFAVTTVIAALVFALVYAILVFELIGLDDVPLLPDFTR